MGESKPLRLIIQPEFKLSQREMITLRELSATLKGRNIEAVFIDYGLKYSFEPQDITPLVEAITKQSTLLTQVAMQMADVLEAMSGEEEHETPEHL